MSRRRPFEQHNYWPGYVDALTNIALNLLFLVAIFVIGVGALGVIASKRVDPSTLPPVPEQTLSEKVKGIVRQIIIQAPDVGQVAKLPKVEVEYVDKSVRSVVVRLGFEANRFLLDSGQQSEISRQLVPELSTATKIELSAHVDDDDGLVVRGAMTRLLSVRNMLIRAGVPAERIDSRIISDKESSNFGQNIFLKISKEVN